MKPTDVWTGSKKQKDALRRMFDGRCAYCGEVLVKMQADHLLPVVRIHTDPWGRRLPVEQQRLMFPERNTVTNMMPACPPCNNHKGGYKLEQWRDVLQRSHEILARDKSIYKAALRMGLITETKSEVVFHFERVRGDDLA